MDKARIAKWLAASGVSAAAAISGGYLIAPQEGAVTDKQGMHVAYLDAVGVPTICYGQTGTDLQGNRIKIGMKKTEEECLQMLASTIKSFEKQVDSYVKVPYASPYQKAALVSFSYNVGINNFRTSTHLRELNSGNHQEACEQLTKWVYAQKKKLKGLVTRRDEEMRWCLGQVPYEAKVTYSQIVDLVKQTSDKR